MGVSVLPQLPPPYGVFRRRIRIASDECHATADLEDNQHRFGVDIIHNGHAVKEIKGRALRTPWTTCALAASELRTLVDTGLLRSPFAVLHQISIAKHCTHMIDLAAIAVSAAARTVRQRQYDAVFELSNKDGVDWRIGTLKRDGTAPTRWIIRDGLVCEPKQYAGLEARRIARGLLQLTED